MGSSQTPDTFNFMGLPGEIRNRIYEFALASESPNVYGGYYNHTTDAESHRGLHLLGLTQVNSVIRAEFRPLWLPEFSIPITIITNFIKVFYPHPPPRRVQPGIRHRIARYHNTEGSLKISARLLRLTDTDILPLIKHKHRFSNMQVIIRRRFNGHTLSLNRRADLRDLLDNDNEKWRRWIRNGIITQVRLTEQATIFKIVVKVKHAQDWMKKARVDKENDSRELQRELGLTGMRLDWGVAYY